MNPIAVIRAFDRYSRVREDLYDKGLLPPPPPGAARRRMQKAAYRLQVEMEGHIEWDRPLLELVLAERRAAK